MVQPFSIDDAFTIGVSFDLLGGFLLGRGLLASPSDIARRTTRTSRFGGDKFNAAEAVTHIRSRADGQAGLISLGVGFALQWGGYVALIAGATVDTGGGRALASVGLALAASIVAYLCIGALRSRLVVRMTVDVARADPLTGLFDIYPDAYMLVAMGRALSIPFDDEHQHINDIRSWAKEHFGVDHVGFVRKP